ncbi:MAG: DUF6778 family protein [Paracoccus sp. (in: a-proteobacteria)]|jgi:hypothetical protein
MLKSTLLVVGLALSVAGCASSNWETAYTQVDAAKAANWRLAAVDVKAPETLTTSEENSYTPNYDVVWHGEPYGDRRAQAAAIIKEGIERGASSALTGREKVRIVATITQFHAITPKVRGMDGVGVHNIQYTIQVFDAKTGAALTEPQNIKAEFPAMVGDEGDAADAKGLTQRVQIVNHVALVTQNWLGKGPDPRGKYSRLGR